MFKVESEVARIPQKPGHFHRVSCPVSYDNLTVTGILAHLKRRRNDRFISTIAIDIYCNASLVLCRTRVIFLMHGDTFHHVPSAGIHLLVVPFLIEAQQIRISTVIKVQIISRIGTDIELRHTCCPRKLKFVKLFPVRSHRNLISIVGI